ncbi:MAG: hypothetical protein PHI71_17120 [Acidiphilium sp.]|nr:hypothetical protein [Acidiphilium sp.]MDD5107587.1 hypothetical protein [Desulfuromonadaceae bacterium]
MNCLTPQLTVLGFPARTGAYIPKTVQAQQYLIEWRNAGSDSPDFWLRGIICEAFKRMITRRMQDAPAADVIDSVAADWIDIVGEGMTEEQDRERIIAGFKLIFRECKRWPQPAELLKRLPRRIVKPQAGTVNVEAADEGSQARSAEAIDAILESLA